MSIVLGVPTVKRETQSYLLITLQSLIDNMEDSEREDVLIVVFVADTDIRVVGDVTRDIEEQFGDHLKSGLLEVISPPANFYPDPRRLKQTLGTNNLRTLYFRTKECFFLIQCLRLQNKKE